MTSSSSSLRDTLTLVMEYPVCHCSRRCAFMEKSNSKHVRLTSANQLQTHQPCWPVLFLFKGPINIFRSAREINGGARIKKQSCSCRVISAMSVVFLIPRSNNYMFYCIHLADSFIRSTLQERNTLRSHLGFDTLTCCFYKAADWSSNVPIKGP